MSKNVGLPPQIASPNLALTNEETLASAYDVLIAKKESFVTPGGRKGTTVVFSRVGPQSIKADKTGTLRTAAMDAKQRIEKAVGRTKMEERQKNFLLKMMAVKISGNTTHSSKEFLSADQTHAARKLLAMPEAKLVRFVDAETKTIPDKPLPLAPRTTELPELPPDD